MQDPARFVAHWIFEEIVDRVDVSGTITIADGELRLTGDVAVRKRR